MVFMNKEEIIQEIVRLRSEEGGEKLSLLDLSQKLGITRERVRQLEAQAVKAGLLSEKK